MNIIAIVFGIVGILLILFAVNNWMIAAGVFFMLWGNNSMIFRWVEKNKGGKRNG